MNAPQRDLAAMAQRSAALVADVELGLTAIDPDVRDLWHAKAQARVDALVEVGDWLGRFAHEDQELQQLQTLLARHGGDQ